MKKIKKTIIAVAVLALILGLSLVNASAQAWTWGDPYVVSTKVTRIAAGDALYGINEEGGIFLLTLSVTETGIPAAPGPISAVRDIAVGSEETVFAVMDALIATWSPASGFTALPRQPMIPGLPGLYKQIASGSDGYIHVLYEKETGEQYILRGRRINDGMVVSFSPVTLDLKSKGNWVSCKVTLPAAYDEKDIDPDSIEITRIQAPVPNGTPVDAAVSIFRAQGSPWNANNNFLQVKFLRYDKSSPDNPQSLNAVLTGLLPPPGSKKVIYQVTVTVLARLKTTGEWFEGTATFNVPVHKQK
jgi:hypothetical protein